MRLNERTIVGVPTCGFRALNNSSGADQTSHSNLHVHLGSRAVQYTQHSNFEASNTQHMARAHPITQQRHPRSSGHTN